MSQAGGERLKPKTGSLAASQMPLRLDGQLRWGDYLRSQYLHLRPRPLLAVVGVAFLVLLAWGLYDSVSRWIAGRDTWLFPAMFGAVLLYLVLYFCVMVPISAYRIFNQQKSLNLPFSIEASPEALSSFNETGKSVMPWNHFVKWKEGGTLFLIYHSDVMFQLVPKRFFQSHAELNEFRGFLAGVRRAG